MSNRADRVINKAKAEAMFILLLVGMICATNSVFVTAQSVIEVPSQYATIQQAINKAAPGETVMVAAGTYNENIVLNKSNLALSGAGQASTFVSAVNPSQPTVSITASNVSISGFTITGGTKGVFIYGSNMSTVENNTIASNSAQGIDLDISHNNIIINNSVFLNDYAGITAEDSTHNSFSCNTITKNKYAAISLSNSNYTEIGGNTISFHDNIPLHAQAVWLTSSQNCKIDNNIILNNAWAIDISFSGDNIFYSNIISHNRQGASLESSDNNIFFHNNFLNNTNQVDSFESSGVWDSGYPSGGNYWSDYTGTDSNSDGIGDTRYVIDVSNTDNYPLIERWHPTIDFTPPITTDDYDKLWHTQDFVIKLAAEDFSGVKAIYYRADNVSTICDVGIDGQPFFTSEKANHTLEYWSVDYAGNNETHHYLTQIKLDKTAPTGSFEINNGSVYTTSRSVELNLSASDAVSGVSKMRFSLNGFAWFTSEPYATQRNWNLTAADGLKTIYVEYQDKAGILSQSYSDTIILDTAPPSVFVRSPSNNSEVQSADVTVEWNGTDSGSGIDHSEIRLDDNFWIDLGGAQSYAFTGLVDGRHAVRVRVTDKIGQSQEVLVSFLVNTHSVRGYQFFEVALGATVVAVVVVLVLYFFKIRKKR